MEQIIYKTTAVWNPPSENTDGHYYDFGIIPEFASIYGHKTEDVVELDIIIHENQATPTREINTAKEPDYWGWFEDKENDFTMIYPKWNMLDMCFYCGVEKEERVNGGGKAYRLKIINEKGKR